MKEDNYLLEAIEKHDKELPVGSNETLIMDDSKYLLRQNNTAQLCESILKVSQKTGLTVGKVLDLISDNEKMDNYDIGLKDRINEEFPDTSAALDFLIKTFGEFSKS